MNIVFVVMGGVDRSGRERVVPALLWLIERLAQRHRLLVIATRQTVLPERYALLGAEIACLGRSQHKIPLLNSVQQIAQIEKIIKHWGKPDVIHGFSLANEGVAAVLNAGWLRIPSIVTLWGGELAALPAIGYGGQLGLKSRLITRFVLRSASALSVGSRFALNQLPIRRHEAHWIPLGVETTQFFPPPTRIATPPWRLLHIASINRVKDPATLLQALHLLRRRYDDVLLDWVGEDTLDGEMQRLCASLGLEQHVTFHGFQTSTVVSRLCQQSHLYLQTSLHESQGVSILESAACSVPTIGTAVGLLPELAPSAAIALLPCTPQILADSVAALLEQPRRLQELGESACLWAQQHNADWSAIQFEQLYAKLCSA